MFHLQSWDLRLCLWWTKLLPPGWTTCNWKSYLNTYYFNSFIKFKFKILFKRNQNRLSQDLLFHSQSSNLWVCSRGTMFFQCTSWTTCCNWERYLNTYHYFIYKILPSNFMLGKGLESLIQYIVAQNMTLIATQI